MTHPEIDVLVIGSGFGLLAGTWLGYKLRGIREYVREKHESEWHRTERSYKQLKRVAKDTGVPIMSLPRNERVTPREIPVKVIPIDTETRSSNKSPSFEETKKTAAKSMEDAMRSMVVEALRGAGYKKSEAEAAVDACNPADRMSLEIWTAAAFRRAILSR